MTSAPLPKATELSPLVASDEPVFWTDLGPRFGDDPWDCREVRRSANHNDRYLDLRTIPTGWQEPTRELLFCLANPIHPEVIQRGIVRQGSGAAVTTAFKTFRAIRTLLRWGVDRGAHTPSVWTPEHSEDLLDALTSPQGLTGRPLAPVSQVRFLNTLRLFWDLRDGLSDHLSEDPWDGRSTNDLAGFVRPIENVTTPLAWTQWAPTVRASWFVIDTLGPDIVAAVQARRGLADRQRRTAGAIGALVDYLDGGGVVPLHTGFGRTRFMKRGEVNLGLLCKQLGYSPAAVSRSSTSFESQIVWRIDRARSTPSRTRLGGVYQPAHADDPANPWEFGLGEIEHLEAVFRGACYVLIAALTGMRDSEIQNLQRNCRTQAPNGVPGLRSTQFKGINAVNGKPRMWFAPAPVLRAVELLEALSVHDTFLFARSTDGGEYFPSRDIPRFVEFVNANPTERIGRGPAFDLDHVDLTADLSQQALRRSFCVFAARYPGAELGLGIQLGHVALRMTSGYTTTSQQHAADLIDHDRSLFIDDMVRGITTGRTPAAGRGTERLRQFRASIITSDSRSDRLIARLAENYHLGSLNDCAYDPDHAACGTDGPQLPERICMTHCCSNAVITERHAPAWKAHIARIDDTLDTGDLHPAFEQRLRSERVEIVQFIRRIEDPK